MKKYNRKKVVSAEAVCPMYKCDEMKKICCDGFEDKIYLQIYFSGVGQKNKYMERYCESMDFYKNCPLYKLAAERFEED